LREILVWMEATALGHFMRESGPWTYAGVNLTHILGVEKSRLVPPDAAKLFRNGRNRMVVLSVLMAVSIAPPFWEVTFLGIQPRIYLWTVPLISYWMGRAVRPESRTYKVT